MKIICSMVLGLLWGSMPAQDHVNTYGILELEGEKFILPLKNDVYIFR
jgi:hypothetical protein